MSPQTGCNICRSIGFLSDSTKMFSNSKLLLMVTHNSLLDCELGINVFDIWELSGSELLKD